MSDISLCEMPEIVMKKILEESDIRSIFTLRKVSRGLRNFIDDVIPDTAFEEISILFNPSNIEVTYTSLNKQSYLVTYRKRDYIQVFCDDVVNILKHQKTLLTTFTLNFDDQFIGNNELGMKHEKILKIFEEKALKIRRVQLKVENYCLVADREDQLLSILSYLDLKFLETITILDPHEYVIYISMRLVELEIGERRLQEIISPRTFVVILLSKLEEFCHFSNRILTVPMVTVDEIVELKESFLHSDSFKNFHIKFEMFPERQRLSEAFGQPYLDERDAQKVWIFEVPDSSKTLKISLSPDAVHFELLVQC